MKKVTILLMLTLFALTLSACDSGDDYFDNGSKKDVVNDEEQTPEMLQLTLEELAVYNGKDGNMAYIAVNDIIYDVTDEWNNGMHNGVSAGTDASVAIGNAPHGLSILEDLVIVGDLVE